MKLGKRLTGVLVATVIMVAMFPGLTANATTSQQGRYCWRYKTSERSFVQKMNGARDRAGRSNLHIDKQLTKVARVHTKAMARTNRLYHTPSSTLSSRVTKWRILGENVGVGGSVTSLHQAFMHSPAHRDNVLFGQYRHVGVGVKMDGNTMWVTVVFESQVDPGTTLRVAPSC